MNQYTNNWNRQHKTYPPINPAEVLEAAYNPRVKAAWVMSGLPQMLANELQAAAHGTPLWPTYEERVNPNGNLLAYARNNNMIKNGRSRHDWTSEDGDVQGAAAAYPDQAAAYDELWHQQQALAQHQQRAAYGAAPRLGQ